MVPQAWPFAYGRFMRRIVLRRFRQPNFPGFGKQVAFSRFVLEATCLLLFRNKKNRRDHYSRAYLLIDVAICYLCQAHLSSDGKPRTGRPARLLAIEPYSLGCGSRTRTDDLQVMSLTR